MSRPIAMFRYVDLPAGVVWERLTGAGDPLGGAVAAARERIAGLLDVLDVDLGGRTVERTADVVVDGVEAPHEATVSGRIRFRVHDREHPVLFPVLEGAVEVSPLTTGVTQLGLVGSYRPPLGVVGEAVDGMVLHRIAEAALERLLDRLVQRLEGAR